MSSRPAFLDDAALRAVLAALPDVRIVGGAVRDAIAGRAISDIDLATSLTPAEVTASLERAGIKAVPTGLDHGTVTAVVGRRGFEVTTLRHDIETDGRHARVAFTDDWRADAARRDFTINAMSMSPDGEVFDYHAGIADLRAGRVRFVGDARLRVAEDHLRILRYFRFLARYGSGDPDPEALAAIREGVPGLAKLSGERVWSELKRILSAPDPLPALRLMADSGALEAVLPSPLPMRKGPGEGFTQRAVYPGTLPGGGTPPPPPPARGGGKHLPPDPILRLAALGPRDTSRLRLSTAEHDKLVAFRLPALPEDADDADIRRALADTPPDILIGRALMAGHDPGRIAATATPVFPLQGRDLQAAGIAPGPEMGALLRDLRAWWLATGCEGDVAAELARRAPHRSAPPR